MHLEKFSYIKLCELKLCELKLCELKLCELKLCKTFIKDIRDSKGVWAMGSTSLYGKYPKKGVGSPIRSILHGYLLRIASKFKLCKK